MKFLLLILFALSGCSNCAGKKDLDPEMIHRRDRSVALIGFNTMGHGCPVGGYIFTATHVIDKVHGVNWSDQYGNSGHAVKNATSRFSDLARMTIDPDYDLPIQNALKLNVSEVGDDVYWFEYDWRTGKNTLRESFRSAKVLRVVANHVVISAKPVSGASGGCLFAEGGSVIGVMVWAFTAEDDFGAGVAARILVADTQ